MLIKFKTITIHQSWELAYDDWFGTHSEKRSFKEQLLMIQSPTMTFDNTRSVDSYFCQLKKGKKAIHADAENFAKEYFGINRKNK